MITDGKMWRLVRQAETARVFCRGIDFRIRSTMLRWCAGNRETTLEDLAQQTQFLLDLRGGNQKAAGSNGRWTEAVRRNAKNPKGRKNHVTVW